MDIRACAIPPKNNSLGIAQRDCAGTKPAIKAIDSPQPVLGLISFPGLHAAQPMLHARLAVIRMHVFHPARSYRRARRRPGIFIEATADIVSAPIRPAAENDVWSGLH